MKGDVEQKSIPGFDFGAMQQKERHGFLLASTDSAVQSCVPLIVLNIQICRWHNPGWQKRFKKEVVLEHLETAPCHTPPELLQGTEAPGLTSFSCFFISPPFYTCIYIFNTFDQIFT